MRLKKIVNLIVLCVFVAFVITICLSSFNNLTLIGKNKNNLKIYELWHIESFEGGGANRQNYLNQLALAYEKQNPTQLFMIKKIEADQLENALKQSTPHLISFSEQVSKTVLPYLIEFDSEYNIQTNFIESAKYNGKLMALAFIASGYCYFTKSNSTTEHIYTANNNLHNATDLISTPINNNQTLSSYECYSKFVNNKNIKLLGTARDLFRVKNLESLGRFNVTYEPVDTFTDLVQYLGATTNNNDILKFVNYILSDFNQLKLTNLSLFSTKHLKLYTEPTYMEMEHALKSCFVPNIFK